MTITRGSEADRVAYDWARREQGYAGTWHEWLHMPTAERQEFEDGAAGGGSGKTVLAMTQINGTLIAGKKYDISALNHLNWTDGDGTGHDCYDWQQYFAADGTYLGADQHGIEPTFAPRGSAPA